MKKLLGSDLRIKVYAKSIDSFNVESDYNVEILPTLEYWVYTNASLILKYHKGLVLKSGYAGLFIRDDSFNYHINVVGSVNKYLAPGELKIDVMIGLPDSETTEFKYLETIDTGINLIKKPISQ